MGWTAFSLRFKGAVILAGLFVSLVGAAPLLAGPDTASATGGVPLVRMGISEKMLRGVNMADAKAALLVWGQELAKAMGAELEAKPDFVMPSEGVVAAIRAGTVDLFMITVQEYREVASYVDTGPLITNDYGGDELLLVVREGGGILKLADLRGRSLILLDSPQTNLALPWLSVSLWREGLESPEQLLGRMTKSTKLSQVVLPLFFGQADACLIMRRGLDTMIELNPQLSRKMKILLSSPKMINGFLAWRQSYPPAVKRLLFDRLLQLKSNVAARHLLTLFQSSGYIARDGECLRPVISMLETYDRGRGRLAVAKR